MGLVVAWEQHVGNGPALDAELQDKAPITEEQAWRLSEAWLNRAEAGEYARYRLTKINSGKMLRLNFRPSGHNGIPVFTSGGVFVELYGRGGKVFAFQRHPDFTYEPFDLGISEIEAIQHFRERCTQLLRASPEDVRVVNFGYRSGSGGELVEVDRSREERDRIARVSYNIEGTVLDGDQRVPLFAWVDAETGQIVRSGFLKGQTTAAKPTTEQKHPQSGEKWQRYGKEPYFILASYVVVGSLLFGGLVYATRKLRNR